MSYENDVEAENARLKETCQGLQAELQTAFRALEKWREASGVPLPSMTVSLRSRAEAAEDRERTALRERDEARAKHEEAVGVWTSRVEFETERREAAEADCATLQGEVFRALAAMRGPGQTADEALGRGISILENAPVPGGGMGEALLKRLRAAEKESDARRTLIRITLSILGAMPDDNCAVVVAKVVTELRAAETEVNRLRQELEDEKVVHRAAVAVVEAARPMLDMASSPVRVKQLDVLEDAIAAYDARGATGETVEPHTHDDPDANGCRPCDRADAEGT